MRAPTQKLAGRSAVTMLLLCAAWAGVDRLRRSAESIVASPRAAVVGGEATLANADVASPWTTGQASRTVAGADHEFDREQSAPFSRRTTTIAGRLWFGDAPVVSAPVLIHHIQEGAEGRSLGEISVHTDEVGGFEFETELVDTPLVPSVLSFRPSSGNKALRVPYDFTCPKPLEAVRNDVGDVVVPAPPRLLSGYVVSADGEPIADAKLVVSYTLRNETTNLASSGRLSSLGSTNSEGHFSLRYELDPRSLGVVDARHPDYGQSASREFRPGDENVVIELARGTDVRGNVLLDPLIWTSTLAARLDSIDAPLVVVSRIVPITSDGMFVFPKVQPGEYTVSIRQEPSLSGSLYRSSPTRVRADRGELELAPIDLRGGLVQLQIDFVDGQGDPVAGVRMRRVDEAGIKQPWHDLTTASDTELLARRGAYFGYEFDHDEYQRQQLSSVASDTTVVFARTGLVRIEAPVAATVDAPFKLLAALTPIDARVGFDRTVKAELDEQGVAILKTEREGDHRLHLVLSYETSGPSFQAYVIGVDGSSGGERIFVYPSVDAGPQLYTSRVGEEELQSAFQQLDRLQTEYRARSKVIPD